MRCYGLDYNATYSDSAEDICSAVLVLLTSKLTSFITKGTYSSRRAFDQLSNGIGADQRLKIDVCSSQNLLDTRVNVNGPFWEFKDSVNSPEGQLYLSKAVGQQEFDSSSYQALGACFNPYKTFLRSFQTFSCRNDEVHPAIASIHARISLASLLVLSVQQYSPLSLRTYTFQNLWQAVVLFEMAMVGFTNLFLMEDLWFPSCNHELYWLIVNAHWLLSMLREEHSPISCKTEQHFVLGALGSELSYLTPLFVLEERGLSRGGGVSVIYCCDMSFFPWSGYVDLAVLSFACGVRGEWKFDVQCLLL
ncbi:hypothetical protein Tco_0544205 [Tanacetum coccineum]